MSSSKPNLRSSASFPNLLLSCLSLTLFALSAASVGPTVLIRAPPTEAGVALLAVSAASLASAAAGVCTALTRRLCFLSHVAFLVAALAGQVLAALALFAREGPALARLGSRRDPREGKMLARVECGLMTAMAILQAAALLLTCAVQACWVRDHRRMEADVDAAARRVGGGGRRVADAGEEIHMGKKKTNNHAQWVKTDFEG